jgi:hypothetical protein
VARAGSEGEEEPLGVVEPVWRKSSSSNTDNCIEVAFVGSGALVRDSKDVRVPHLAFGSAAWGAFLDGIRSGEFRGGRPSAD